MHANGHDCQAFLKLPLKVLKLEQNTPEWLALRKTKRTASETPIVLGLSPWRTPGDLAIEKFSDVKVDNIDNAATRHGHKYEDTARRAYEDMHACFMRPCVVTRGNYLASLDGWRKDKRVVLEIKCPYSRGASGTWKQALQGKVEDHYYYQIQHQLMVSGSESCDLWAFNTDDMEGALVSIPRNPGAFTRILKAWEEFVRKYG